jgi:uncharacterized protein (TIGR02145 family)
MKSVGLFPILFVAALLSFDIPCIAGEPISVVIGTQTWMAKNMDAKPSKGNSICYDNKPKNCAKFGRLYDFQGALSVCPEGWHLPTRPDLDTLIAILGNDMIGKQLKSKSGWKKGSEKTEWGKTTTIGGSGSDDFGFSALPAGQYHLWVHESFEELGESARFWYNDYYDGNTFWLSSSFDEYESYPPAQGGVGYSVRCLLSFAYTPSFSLTEGKYHEDQSLRISSEMPGAQVYYTTDGSIPTTTSKTYAESISISGSQTIKAIAVKAGFPVSSVTTAYYTFETAAPIFSLLGGSFHEKQTLTISSATSGAQIYYTTDGSIPTTASKLYTESIRIYGNQTINAISVKAGFHMSSVTTAYYTFETATPVASLSSGTYWGEQTVNLSSQTPDAIIYYSTDGTTPTESSKVFDAPIIINRESSLKAISMIPGWNSSSVLVQNYTVKTPFIDPRDKQSYKTTKIGKQTWLAQNLNFDPKNGNSWCYNDDASNCKIYGRLYSGPTAMKACPSGWHLPSTTEWNTLEISVGGKNKSGESLSASTLSDCYDCNDNFGFSALPAGSRHNSYGFRDLNKKGFWWTVTALETGDGCLTRSIESGGYINRNCNPMESGYSIRCIKD